MRGRTRRGAPTTSRRLRAQSIPVPVGINAVDSLAALGPRDAAVLINFISGSASGLQPRPGTIEQARGVGSTPGEVRSLLAYHGSNSTTSRLFAGAPDGLYDITTPTATPTRVLTFASTGADSGRGADVTVVTPGDRFHLYADETNGLVEYAESLNSWSVPTISGGITAASVSFVTQWRQRVWLVERGTTRSWYLAPGAVAGAATVFDFGPLFRHGGTLVGLWPWSVDNGSGANDFLIAVSSSGDVVSFAPFDPASPNFQQNGDWFFGGFPAGRRVAVRNGGDILLLTLQGVISLSKQTNGPLVSPDTYETRNIRPLLVSTMSDQASYAGWELQIHPKQNLLVVNSPGLPGATQEQFVMSYATRGWSRLQGLDMLSTCVWNGDFYFGTRDGRVMRSSGPVDNVRLGGDYSAAKDIRSMLLCAPLSGGETALKVASFILAHYQTKGIQPGYSAIIRYEYDMSEAAGAVQLYAPSTGLFTWDETNWDEALWADATVSGGQNLQGIVGGPGHVFAPGVIFTSHDYFTLQELDVGWEEGGLL